MSKTEVIKSKLTRLKVLIESLQFAEFLAISYPQFKEQIDRDIKSYMQQIKNTLESHE